MDVGFYGNLFLHLLRCSHFKIEAQDSYFIWKNTAQLKVNE